MRVSDILHNLPASLEWMVLFNLITIRRLAADDNVVRAMFFLPTDANLDAYSHAILSSDGHLLAPHAGSELLLVKDTALTPYPSLLTPHSSPPSSLFHRFTKQLQLFPIDEADCLGLGEQAPFPPVLLFLQANNGLGEAKALFAQPPSLAHYDLLPAAGLKFEGGSQQGLYYVAEFTNRLPVHFHAGILAHFTRTSHCNRFFLRHGNIDFQLALGLTQAARDRVVWARDRSLEATTRLGQRACRETLALTCQPPPPASPYPFGNLVPLGFVLKALKVGAEIASSHKPDRDESIQAARGEVEQLLLDKRQGPLWAYHTGHLVTATDSALVLQGLSHSEAIEALEIFADGQGGYYPQLWADTDEPGRMTLTPANRHWCQPDYATTCLIRALRQAAGLPEKTPLDYLVAGFEARSGLYFANPYLVDWALAQAIASDEAAASLRQRLLADLLGSMHADYTFGGYDVALSTSLAILSMAALGYSGRTMRLAQLHLLDFMEAGGLWPAATPFYSTLSFDHTRLSAQTLFNLMLNDSRRQMAEVNGQYHAITFYEDTPRLIATSLAALALSEKCQSTMRDPEVIDRANLVCHPRYQSDSPSFYIARFALPPYLSGIAPHVARDKV
ncbi:MAG: hypothetical protein JXM69_12995 [Anaerolineae bacterium]|nr:hypothetical protein [Anaerolineae bacterium]